ncbi:MAG TPA: ABC transporter permease, partial [Candidatus Polarisedimenticolia bacterium]|nr:ABC transporter permease [Candidatus Polarisedimenticolia bacterium]
MAAFVARRIAVALLLVWGVVTVTFLLIHAAPGDPAELSQTKDLPLPQQYGRYLYGLARGDLGWSSSYQRPVASVLVEHLPPTLELTALAFALQLVAGVWAGSIAAWRRGSWADAILSGGSLALRSMPLFVLGALLILVFSVNLRWLPSSEMRDLVAAPTSFWGGLFDRGRHLFLPVICLGLGSAGSTARSVRS